MTENERRSLLGLFPTPDGDPFDQADIQQVLHLFRMPIVGFSIPVVGAFIKRAFTVANPPRAFSIGNRVRGGTI